MKYFLIFFFAFPFVSHASSDFISINPVNVTLCGSQTVTISGTATYSTGSSDLEVFKNGVLASSLGQPGSYSVPLTYADGSNRADVKIMDSGVELQHGFILFDIDACAVPVISTPVSSSTHRSSRRHAVTTSLGQQTISVEVVRKLIAIFQSLK